MDASKDSKTRGLCGLLLWLRENGYIVQSVAVGDASVVVHDAGAIRGASATVDESRPTPERSIEERWAKDLGMPPPPGSEDADGGEPID